MNIHIYPRYRKAYPGTVVTKVADCELYVQILTSSVVLRQNHHTKITGRYEDLLGIMVVLSSSMNPTWVGKLGIAII